MSSLIIPFTNKTSDSSSLETWATLEQEYTSDSDTSANLTDMYQMKARAISGKTAMSYVEESCPYATITGDVLTVKLDFFVWVSSLSIDYELSSGVGTIGPAVKEEAQRSFDLVIKDSNSADLDFLFTGIFTPSMPFLGSNGPIIPQPTVELNDYTVTLSEPATVVLRGNGIAHGFRHTLTIVLTSTDVNIVADKDLGNPDAEIIDVVQGYALDNLETTITVSWTDSNGEVQSNVLDIEVPSCIEDLLTTCTTGNLPIINENSDEENRMYLVYFSTCNGKVLDEYWEAKE